MKVTRPFWQIVLTFCLTISILCSVGAPLYAADFTGKTIIDVSISGNKTVTESSIMQVVKVKAGDLFNAEATQQDMRAIYGLGNFYDVQANFIEVPEGIKLVYSVIEKTTVKEIVFKGNTKVSTENLQSLVAALKGNLVDNKTLNDKSQAIEQYYHDQGYILAKVNNRTIDQDGIVTIFINEGIVEGFVVKGNEKTKTNVITREMNVKKEEPFNAKDAKRSIQKIYNLGFFEDVNIKLNPGREPNAIVVEIDVKEKKTGTFSVGGGYSQTDGMSAMIGIGDSNFNGSGNKVNLNLQHGLTSVAGSGWDISYTNPWVDDKQTSFSIDYFNSINDWNDYGLNGDNTTLRSTYYRRSRGFNITLGRPQGEYVKNYITYTDRKDLYQQYVSGPINYLETNSSASDYNVDYNSQYLQDNFGVVHSVTLSRVYDNRDNVFNPTEGKRISLTSEFAGDGLGGQFNFDKYTFDGRQYFKVGSKQTLAFRLTGGYALGNVPDASQYVIGGIDTLRGYNDEEFKGNKMFTATVEYRYPIVKKVDGVIFTDAGNAWDGDGYNLNGLKHSFGTGLRVDTPIGPIKLDFAHGEEGNKFHFGFGGQF
jgi:outer membrane protein insertion porin family